MSIFSRVCLPHMRAIPSDLFLDDLLWVYPHPLSLKDYTEGHPLHLAIRKLSRANRINWPRNSQGDEVGSRGVREGVVEV